MHNNVNNFFFISYDLASDLAFDLDAAMGVVSEGPRKGRRGRETQATRGKGNVRLRGPESPRSGRESRAKGRNPQPARPPAAPWAAHSDLRRLFAGASPAWRQRADRRQMDGRSFEILGHRTIRPVADFVTFKPTGWHFLGTKREWPRPVLFS